MPRKKFFDASTLADVVQITFTPAGDDLWEAALYICPNKKNMKLEQLQLHDVNCPGGVSDQWTVSDVHAAYRFVNLLDGMLNTTFQKLGGFFENARHVTFSRPDYIKQFNAHVGRKAPGTECRKKRPR